MRWQPAVIPLLLAGLLAGGSCTESTGAGGQQPSDGPPGAVEVVWRVPIAGRDIGMVPAVDDELLFTVAHGITAYRVRDGHLSWQTPTGLVQSAPSKIIERAGRILIAEQSVHAFDSRTGEELWRFRPAETASLCQPAADDEAMYFGTGGLSHLVYAISLVNGQPLWQRDIGPEWPFAGWISGVAVSGDTVYVGATEDRTQNGHLTSGWIVALDRESGRILWRHASGAGDTIRSVNGAPVVHGDFVIASDAFGNSFYAVNRFSGREAWRIPGRPNLEGPTASPVVKNDRVYVGSGDTFVYAADIRSGRLLWQSSHERSSILYLAVCGSAIFAQEEGVEVFDLNTGAWRQTLLNADDDFITSGFATLGDSLIFAHGTSAVYALRCPK
ncbi:MAG TPA: PQQ-binding-like beta-propeller repeat protein [Gemmatimonadaceae bacterium]|nr:PQQ-binding-like beta-propeller repeat protein [Gemmatimonadaceae bacterium]